MMSMYEYCAPPRTQNEAIRLLPAHAGAERKINMLSQGLSDKKSGKKNISVLPANDFDWVFEHRFATHRQKRGRSKSWRCGVVGASLGGVGGAGSSPLLVPGLVLAALAGGAGGSCFAKCRNQRSLRVQDLTIGEDPVGPLPQRPSLRRLLYLAYWGHWQLTEYETSPPEWRIAVLDEVIPLFSPWLQRMYLLQARGATVAGDGSEEAQEVFHHLAPLYRFLQRGPATETVLQASDLVTLAFDKCMPDASDVHRCRMIFPTIKGTISIMDALSPTMQANFLHARSFRKRTHLLLRTKSVRQHRRLQRILVATEVVLTRKDVQETLSGRRKWAERELSRGLDLSVPTQAYSAPESAPSSPRRLLPFVAPPEGTENEVFGIDDANTDVEFHSCSGESDLDVESGRVPAPRPPSLTPARRIGCYRDRYEAFPRGNDAQMWNVAKSTFKVRSQTYLHKRVKVASGPPLLDLVGADFMCIGEGGPVWNAAKTRDFCPLNLRSQGEKRFLLIQNWILPPFQVVLVGALNPDALWLVDDTPQSRTWHSFLAMSPEEKRAAFKIIVEIENGPWLLKRAVPNKPIIIGKQVLMDSHHEEGDHLELTLDVSSGKVEAMGCGMIMKALKRLKLSVGMMIEAKKEDELPENLLLSIAVQGLDTSVLYRPDASK